jgi:lipopolysaccharide biosynthesis regulator YciM
MTNEMKNPQMLSLQESSVSESQRQIAVEDEYKLRELELRVERQRETLGDSHFNALEAMHDLSLEYQFSQQWEKAYDLQQEIVEIRKRELGDTHPDTLRSMVDLAPIIDEREGGEAFQKFSLDLLATRELVLGHSHPDTLESVEQLAIWYENERECDKALPLYERLEKASSSTYGIDQHETIEASCGIARMLLMQGRLGEAREKQTFTYQTSLAKHGPEHDSTLASAADLARIARAQGDVQEAMRLEQANAELYVGRFGEDFHTGLLRQMG